MGRRFFIAALIVGVIVALGIREYRLHRESPTEEAFVGGRGATVWNSTAQIRTAIATLKYGQHVQVYQHYAQEALVSTSSGVRGWVSSASLIDSQLWRSAELLSESAKDMPVEAIGHTRARTNLHTRPGVKAPVILEAPSDSPLVIFEHATVAPPAGSAGASAKRLPNYADWCLVRANVENVGVIVGWALNRLITLDLPEALRDYQASEGMAIVAWFEIDRALDARSHRYRPEYLVAGTRGQQAGCDFTLLRVYTWSPVRHRYETAFMDSHVCGKLPAEVRPAQSPQEDAYFGFENAAPSGDERRTYRMRLTTVRRIDTRQSPAKSASEAIRGGRTHS